MCERESGMEWSGSGVERRGGLETNPKQVLSSHLHFSFVLCLVCPSLFKQLHTTPSSHHTLSPISLHTIAPSHRTTHGPPVEPGGEREDSADRSRHRSMVGSWRPSFPKEIPLPRHLGNLCGLMKKRNGNRRACIFLAFRR